MYSYRNIYINIYLQYNMLLYPNDITICLINMKRLSCKVTYTYTCTSKL